VLLTGTGLLVHLVVQIRSITLNTLFVPSLHAGYVNSPHLTDLHSVKPCF
jgi:hypothetical protein